jgi:hypothetical protein
MSDRPAGESPESLLDAIRDRRDWNDADRDEALDRLVTRFDPERIREALASRLDQLDGDHGAAVLRLIEAFGTPALLRGLLAALERRLDLPPERTWETFSVLAASGPLPESLSELIEDIEEAIEGHDDAVAELAALIENDPDGLTIAREGLALIEPDLREEVLAELAADHDGPGVRALLKIMEQEQEQEDEDHDGPV